MAAYIPPHKRDTRYALWYVRYDCRIPYIQMLDPEDLIKNGLPTSGDKHHDHAMQWEPRTVGLPIHRMAELWATGANISLIKASDALPIYQAIEKHLLAWKFRIESRFNAGRVPEEDLMLLDRFANSIYVHAKPFFNELFITEHFQIAGKSKHSRRSVMARVRAMEIEEDKQRVKQGDVLSFSHIKVVPAMQNYDRERLRNAVQVDYSGEETVTTNTPRQSLTAFLRKR